MKKKQKVYAIAGATASGKTKYAIELAHKLDGEIISADSRMIYKHFDIGTAKPTLDERENIPHHLIDIIEPTQDYSVANFVDDAHKLIPEIISRGKTPIITGGTGLYFKVLCDNYNLPRVEANAELRHELETIAQKEGAEKLHKMLQELDQEAAEKIHPNNIVRVVRTIEIIKSTGQKISQIATRNEKNENYEFELIGLNFTDREKLYTRINARVDEMFTAGLQTEAENLFAKYGKIKSLMSTIGYQEFAPLLDGNSTIDDVIEKIKQNTRNYAKRQISLLKLLPDLKQIDIN